MALVAGVLGALFALGSTFGVAMRPVCRPRPPVPGLRPSSASAQVENLTLGWRSACSPPWSSAC